MEIIFQFAGFDAGLRVNPIAYIVAGAVALVYVIARYIPWRKR